MRKKSKSHKLNKKNNKKSGNILERFRDAKRTTKILFVVIMSLIILIVTAIVLVVSNDGIRESVALAIARQTKKELIVEEELDFDVINEDSEEIFIGNTEVQQEGQKGILEITYKVIYDKDGNEISREKIAENLKKEPIVQINKIGIKEPIKEPSSPIHYEINHNNANTNYNTSSQDNTTTPNNNQPAPAPEPVKTYTDAEIIAICNNAIVAKYGWALTNGDAGSDDKGPRVTNLGNNQYQVRGWRRTGAWSFVASGCDISNGTVTSILR